MTTAVSRPSAHPRKPDKEDDNRLIFENRVFATQRYIPWFIGQLRLGDRPDFSRVERNQARVLTNHSGAHPIGRVTRAWHDRGGQVFRSNFEIPKIPATENARQLIEADLMRDISVGAKLNWDAITLDNADEDWESIDDARWTAHEWEFVEESMTPIPADGDAGLDRVDFADLLREDPEVVVFGAGQAAMHERTMAKHRPRLERLIAERKERTMTTQQLPSNEALERAIADALAKREDDLSAKIDRLITDTETDRKANMEYRAKLDSLQFRPQGSVLSLDNWTTRDNTLDLGRILRLTADKELGFPQLDRGASTLEESFLERVGSDLAAPDRSTMARVPFEAVMERERQRMIQRSTMTDAAGVRPVQINVLGNAGLLFNAYAPILAAMDMKMGLRGAQRVPYFTAQGSAAGGAEGADIPITTWTMHNADILPVSIGSAFDLTSSLTAVDDMTFEALVDFAIMTTCNDELCKQVLDGAGSGSNEIAGLWGRISAANPDNMVEYGAAQTDFARSDVLSLKNIVDLSKTDGGPGQFILSTTLYTLAEDTLRGGASSERYLLEDGMMEGRRVHHYKDFAPTGITDAGMFAKLDRVCVMIWGDSFQLQEIPVRARKNEYKMVVEANIGIVQEDYNLAGIRQT